MTRAAEQNYLTSYAGFCQCLVTNLDPDRGKDNEHTFSTVFEAVEFLLCL